MPICNLRKSQFRLTGFLQGIFECYRTLHKCQLAIRVAPVRQPKNPQTEQQRIRGAIAANVRAEMARKAIKADALAELIGLDPSTMWRRIRTDPPPLPFKSEELVRIARVLGVPAASLLPDEPNGDVA